MSPHGLVLKNHANILAGPLTAIFNSSLREGIIPDTWKSANVILLPKVNPPNTIEKDVRPISLTPIASQIWESTILNHYFRVALLDFSKAFDLINHNTLLLLVKLKQYDLPPHIRRWITTFLLDRTQQVKIGNNFSPPGHPKGGVPQGTLLRPKCFLVYINDLETPAPLYKYVDDSTLFEICHIERVNRSYSSPLTSQRGGHYITTWKSTRTNKKKCLSVLCKTPISEVLSQD